MPTNLATDPCTKTVFKVNHPDSAKLPYSRNTQTGCVFCLKQKSAKVRSFPVCSACKSVRYCVSTMTPCLSHQTFADEPQSAEHQKADWANHKPFCKQQRIHQIILKGFPYELKSTTTQYKFILEDWTQLHYREIHQALASAIYQAGPGFDYNRKFARFTVKYRPECGGNPSTAFSLKYAGIEDDPIPGSRAAIAFETIRSVNATAIADEIGNPLYAGHLVCHCERNRVLMGFH